MFPNSIHVVYQILIAFIVCITLTGQSKPTHETSRSYPSRTSTNLASTTRWKKPVFSKDTDRSKDNSSSTNSNGVRIMTLIQKKVKTVMHLAVGTIYNQADEILV
jgi:hypothetical protein